MVSRVSRLLTAAQWLPALAAGVEGTGVQTAVIRRALGGVVAVTGDRERSHCMLTFILIG